MPFDTLRCSWRRRKKSRKREADFRLTWWHVNYKATKIRYRPSRGRTKLRRGGSGRDVVPSRWWRSTSLLSARKSTAKVPVCWWNHELTNSSANTSVVATRSRFLKSSTGFCVLWRVFRGDSARKSRRRLWKGVASVSRRHQPAVRCCPTVCQRRVKSFLGENLGVIRRYGPAGFISAKTSPCDDVAIPFFTKSRPARASVIPLLSSPHIYQETPHLWIEIYLRRDPEIRRRRIQSWNSVRLFTRVHRNVHAYTLITLIEKRRIDSPCLKFAKRIVYPSFKFDRGILTMHLIHVTQRPHLRLTANARAITRPSRESTVVRWNKRRGRKRTRKYWGNFRFNFYAYQSTADFALSFIFAVLKPDRYWINDRYCVLLISGHVLYIFHELFMIYGERGTINNMDKWTAFSDIKLRARRNIYL